MASSYLQYCLQIQSNKNSLLSDYLELEYRLHICLATLTKIGTQELIDSNSGLVYPLLAQIWLKGRMLLSLFVGLKMHQKQLMQR